MKSFLDYASQRYYEGNPVISDAVFDRLAQENNYEYVGAPVKNGVPHTFRMYSLKKCYTDEDLIDLKGDTVESPKLDGAAVSLLYLYGQFTLGLTRGDGIRGQDITDKIRHLVPKAYPYSSDPIVQITGEVVAPKHIPNARNYAAGALNLKDIEEVKSRNLIFIAYGIQPSFGETWEDDMTELWAKGFETVNSQKWINYPQDGRVFRLNDNKKFAEAGYTANHPRGAYALKERQEGVVTKLLDVVWQVGRTGVVSPVAILDPVLVGDATVSKATLHNYKYISELNLEIGCLVEIIRSGEIIPRVVRRVNETS